MKFISISVLAIASLLAADATAKPRLGVLVVVDQLRSVEIDRLAPVFGTGGFGGFQTDSAARFDARYPYGVCETSPGHATLSTGASPAVHGIISNRWWDGEKLVYAVGDTTHPVLGNDAPDSGRGPTHLRVGTLADAMKIESLGKSKVITVAHKDRAAILTAGHSADLALWYDNDLGEFTTSSAYAKELPSWVTEQQSRVRKSWQEGRWTPLPIPKGMEALFPEDDRVGEKTNKLGGRMFPHDLSSLSDVKQQKAQYRASPQAVEDIFELALSAVREEKLGEDLVPDFLVVGVSATDYVGHWFGPHSLEMTDLLRRLDLSLRDFMRKLENRLGRDGYVLVLAADHGSTPLPEALRRIGYPARRIPGAQLEKDIATAVEQSLKTRDVQAILRPPHLWLHAPNLKAGQKQKALSIAEEVLERTPGIESVYRLDEYNNLRNSPDPFVQRMRLAIYPPRSGDLLVRHAPRMLFDFASDDPNAGEGIDHSAPYIYDARIPVFVRGTDVRRGRYAQMIDPRDVPATLAFLLGVPPPDACEGTPVEAVGTR